MSTVNLSFLRPRIPVDQRLDRRDRGSCPATDDHLDLAGGTRVALRALEPTDRDGLATVFDRLSERSRTQRFLGPKKQLTDGDLTRLCAVDHVEREAIIAIDPADGSIIAVARYCASPVREDVAELAGAVVDEWQGRGIGHELLTLVIKRARANGIATLTASVLSENVPASTLLARAGFATTRRGYGVSELQLELTPDSSQPTTGTASLGVEALAVTAGVPADPFRHLSPEVPETPVIADNPHVSARSKESWR